MAILTGKEIYDELEALIYKYKQVNSAYWTYEGEHNNILLAIIKPELGKIEREIKELENILYVVKE